MTRVLVQVKNICWIFVQNPIQIDLAQYKVKLYLCPGHKTSRNWSKPMKWCAFFRYPEHSSASQFRMSRNNLLHLIHLDLPHDWKRGIVLLIKKSRFCLKTSEMQAIFQIGIIIVNVVLKHLYK